MMTAAKTTKKELTIWEAFAKAQSEVANPPLNKINPHYESRFAGLDDYINAVRPVFNRHGFILRWRVEKGREQVAVECILQHTSGDFVSSGVLTLKTPKDDPQGAGVAITYARRYTIAAVTGTWGDEDTDGEAAPATPAKKAASKKTATDKAAEELDTTELLSDKQLDEIAALLEDSEDFDAAQLNADIAGNPAINGNDITEAEAKDFERIKSYVESKVAK